MLIEPETAEAVAAALKQASDARQSVAIRGASTKRDWGRNTAEADVTLGTRRLHRVLAHPHGDLTTTVEAGAPLGDVNRALAGHGQWLPLDPPFGDRATIGGILATNDSGPLRHRYGTPRDQVIGVRLATTDGTLAKAGGQVVKNVAGYDLSKLVCGSFGALAVIVSATFKLAPVWKASKTIVATPAGAEVLGRLVGAMMGSQLEPVAFEVRADAADYETRTMALLVRFASLPSVVDAQIDHARALLGASDTPVQVHEDDGERALWFQHGERLWTASGAIVRASWLPARIADVLAEIARAHPHGRLEMIGRAAVGTGLIRIDADPSTQAAVIERLRRSTTVGNVVLMRGPAELKSLVDVWGPSGDRQALLESVKRAFDPHGMLNAGRGPL
ncbi:MAG: hypothetical protein A3F69_01140 [Acidobacteria bacterium RIFCSPLOWO2_12_FULL_66_10]|nr:MAG: hypothetical protein A3F69_01140 [Acidobacteria bacterium RIFCSPLOWO2_12_FULL_66_10]